MSKTKAVNLRSEEYDIYAGRRRFGKDGYFGNPHPVGFPCTICFPGDKKSHDRDGAIEAYRKDFERRITTDPEFRSRIEAGKGKRWGCFCKPLPCHVDVIVEYLEKEKLSAS
jgi:hypothetical protein